MALANYKENNKPDKIYVLDVLCLKRCVECFLDEQLKAVSKSVIHFPTQILAYQRLHNPFVAQFCLPFPSISVNDLSFIFILGGRLARHYQLCVERHVV